MLSDSALSDTDLTDNVKYESAIKQTVSNLSRTIKDRDKLERGYTSDSELYNASATNQANTSNPVNIISSTDDVSNVSPQQRNDWILVCSFTNA